MIEKGLFLCLLIEFFFISRTSIKIVLSSSEKLHTSSLSKTISELRFGNKSFNISLINSLINLDIFSLWDIGSSVEMVIDFVGNRYFGL